LIAIDGTRGDFLFCSESGGSDAALLGEPALALVLSFPDPRLSSSSGSLMGRGDRVGDAALLHGDFAEMERGLDFVGLGELGAVSFSLDLAIGSVLVTIERTADFSATGGLGGFCAVTSGSLDNGSGMEPSRLLGSVWAFGALLFGPRARLLVMCVSGVSTGSDFTSFGGPLASRLAKLGFSRFAKLPEPIFVFDVGSLSGSEATATA
jgi:hypothetical protein